MSLISNKKNFLIDEKEEQHIEPYKLPSLVTSSSDGIPIKKALLISTALHPTVVGLIWLLSLILALAGIHLFEFNKIKPPIKKDIEFVLVDKPAQPRDPNTRNRAHINSRSGGVNDPKKKVSMPSPSPKKTQKPSAAAASSNKIIKKQMQKAIQQQQTKVVNKTQTQNNKTQNNNKQTPAQTVVNRPSPAKPAPPTARPSSNPVTAQVPTPKPVTPFNVAAPKGAPIGKTLATGPVGGTSSTTGGAKSGGYSGSSTASGSGSGAYAPRPSLSPSSGSNGTSGNLARGTNGSGSGNAGNPGGGGGAPGIDALREPDFGPYMRELQRRIKMNWDPPKGNESKTVVLLFKIARDGRLLSSRVSRSSGLPTADRAALKAVELTAPFRPLPADYKGQSIDIQFTFDYRVFGARRY